MSLKQKADRKAKSPYQRYQKSPHVYSEAYRRWKAAVKRGDEATAIEAGRQHTRMVRSMFPGQQLDAA